MLNMYIEPVFRWYVVGIFTRKPNIHNNSASGLVRDPLSVTYGEFYDR